MRDLSTRMIEAVLDGEGLRGVAELAAAEAGGPVAIVLPARGLVARAPGEADLNGLAEYTRARIADANRAPPEPIAHEVSIEAGGEPVGLVLLLAEDIDSEKAVLVDRDGVLRAAALATLAEIAVADAREEAERRLRGGLIEELRTREVETAEATSKAARLGCDLGRGAIALVAEITSSSPSHATALVEGEYEGSLAELSDGRLYAILPARGGTTLPSAPWRPPGGSLPASGATGSPRSPPSIPTPASSTGRSARPCWSSTWSGASPGLPRRWRRGSPPVASTACCSGR